MQTATHDNTPAVANGNGHRPDVALSESGVVLRNLDDLGRVSDMIAASGLAPKGDTPQAIGTKILFGLECGLSMMTALTHVAVINGRPSIYGDAIMSRIMSSPLFDFDAFDERFENDPSDLRNPPDDFAAVVTMGRFTRTGATKERTERFSVGDARRANLWGKQGPWSQYPKRMMLWRARSFLARNLFADLLRGFQFAEEARDMPSPTREAVIVQPGPVAATPSALPSSPAPAPSPVESPATVPADQSTDDTPPAFDPLPDDLAVDQVWRSEPGTLPHRFYLIADIVDSDPAVQPCARAWFSDDKELTASPTWNRDLSDRPRRASLTADDFLSLSRVELPTPPHNGGGDVAKSATTEPVATGNYSESPNGSPDPVAQAEATVADWSATQGQGETWNTPEGEPPSRVSVEETSAGFNISGPLGWVIVENAGDGALSDAQKKYLADTENAMAEAGTECPDLIEGVRSLFHAGFVLPTAVARVVSAYVARHGQKKFSNLRVEEKRFFREIASRYAVARRDNTPPA